MASIRRLAYIDRFVWNLEQTVSDIFDDCDGLTDRYVFPDLTTRVPFVMLLSQEQFTTLYSAVLTGADLAFPNTSHDVENLFLQMVTCPMNEFCAALLNCINNDPAIMAAIISALSDAGAIGRTGDPEAPLSDGTLENNLLPDGYSCTDDKAYGMALAIVEAINQATEESLQAIEVATNPVEIASELADNVPGIGLVASAGDVAAWVQNTAQEEYALAWSDAVRDSLACDLWCLILDGCSISLDEIHQSYLDSSLVAPPAGDTLEDWMVWLIAIVFGDPKATAATISMMGLSAMRFGGGFGRFALGVHSLETVIRLAEDDTSNNWSVVCDPCPSTWCYEFDFSVASYWTAGGLTPLLPDEWGATYSPPEWWRNIRFDSGLGHGFAFSLYLLMPIGTVLTNIHIEDEVTGTAPLSPGWVFNDIIPDTLTSVEIVRDNPQAELHAPSSRDYPMDYTFVNTSIMLLVSGGPVAPLFTRYAVTKITLSGTGADPMLSGVAC